jgi:phage gp46-like protein
MSDILLTWSQGSADFSITDNDLTSDEGLETAVLLSLFLDRRLEDGDTPPDGEPNRGWWADAIPFSEGDKIGSRLWTLKREKQSARVVALAKEYALEALEWMKSDGVISRADVFTGILEPGVLGLGVTLIRPALAPLALRRYDYAWNAQLLRRP